MAILRYVDLIYDLNLRLTLRRESDDAWYDPSTQTFPGGGPYPLDMTQDASTKGEYTVDVTLPLSSDIVDLIARVEDKDSTPDANHMIAGGKVVISDGQFIDPIFSSIVPATNLTLFGTVIMEILAIEKGNWFIDKTADPRVLIYYALSGAPNEIVRFTLIDDDAEASRTTVPSP